LFKVFMEEPGGRIGQAQASFGDIICGEGVTYELEPLEFVELNELRSPGFLKHEDPSAGGFQRPATGGWKVWGEFQHRYGVMKSNVLELRIEDDPARTPEVRQALGSEAWHRFALGGESTDADLLTFRKLALTKGDFPQKDILAYTVGLHDLNRSRPGHATTLFRIAGAAPSRNLGRTLLSSALAQCHWELGNYDEALAVMDQAPPGPRDIARKRWATQRAGVLRAKQTEELFQPR
jgi:hypothetical protein